MNLEKECVFMLVVINAVVVVGVVAQNHILGSARGSW